MCLEFSKVANPILNEIYKQYSFNVIPAFGSYITGDRESYQYLVESIERFYSQEELKGLMEEVGFMQATYTNMTNGIVALHSGYKF
jgi:ubiquinone/menaquinone biosynthesis C-methylase UbiE